MTVVVESQGSSICTVLHVCVLELILSINFIKFYLIIINLIDAIKHQY